MKAWHLLTAFACALVLAACAAGRPFTKPDDARLVLGTTTRTEVLALLGAPSGKGQQVTNGESIDTLTYAYARVGEQAAFEGVTPARAYTLMFHRDVLVGRVFVSSFRADSTYFDPEKAKTVKEGMTADEVRALLGKESGEYRYPAAESRRGRSLTYLYTQTKAFRVRHAVLVLELDEGDVVRKSTFLQTGPA